MRPTAKRLLLNAGQRLESFTAELKRNGFEDVKYLVVIEGMASNDGYAFNSELSYERALALYRLWQRAGIRIDSSVCEVVIAGSGTGGVGRYGAREESKNQRFLIQILPKVGAEGWSVMAPRE